RPRRSLSQPASSTEATPTPGNIALTPADSLTLYPRWSRRYIGVQVLKVSRIIVHANDSAQTRMNARLRSNGRSSAPALAGRDSEAANRLRGRSEERRVGKCRLLCRSRW